VVAVVGRSALCFCCLLLLNEDVMNSAEEVVEECGGCRRPVDLVFLLSAFLLNEDVMNSAEDVVCMLSWFIFLFYLSIYNIYRRSFDMKQNTD
jgi:hypothetical protein